MIVGKTPRKKGQKGQKKMHLNGHSLWHGEDKRGEWKHHGTCRMVKEATPISMGDNQSIKMLHVLMTMELNKTI